MVRLRTVQVALAASIISSSQALALEGNWTRFGPRALGMGNAFVAVADDYNALYYNPAGLARLNDWKLELFTPGFEIASATSSGIGEVAKIAQSGGNFAKILSFVEDQIGKNHRIGASFSPYFIKKNFGMGIGIDTGFALQAHNDLDIHLNGGFEVMAPISYARNFMQDKLSVGVTAKLYQGFEADTDLSIDSLSALSDGGQAALKDLASGGMGVGFDAGLLFTPIKKHSPTLGLMVADIGDTKLSPLSDSFEKKAARPMAINMGMSVKPFESESQYVLLAVDTQQVNQPLHFSHKLNLGAEYSLGNVFKVQTGLHDGQLTAGMQLDVKLLKIRLATYAIDHGSVAGLHDNLIDRRYVLQFKLLI